MSWVRGKTESRPSASPGPETLIRFGRSEPLICWNRKKLVSPIHVLYSLLHGNRWCRSRRVRHGGLWDSEPACEMASLVLLSVAFGDVPDFQKGGRPDKHSRYEARNVSLDQDPKVFCDGL